MHTLPRCRGTAAGRFLYVRVMGWLNPLTTPLRHIVCVCVCVTEMACRLRSYIPPNIIIITAGLGLMMRHESPSSCYPPVRLFFISFSFCFQDTQMQVYSRSGWLHPSFPVMCVCV